MQLKITHRWRGGAGLVGVVSNGLAVDVGRLGALRGMVTQNNMLEPASHGRRNLRSRQ